MVTLFPAHFIPGSLNPEDTLSQSHFIPCSLNPTSLDSDKTSTSSKDHFIPHHFIQGSLYSRSLHPDRSSLCLRNTLPHVPSTEMKWSQYKVHMGWSVRCWMKHRYGFWVRSEEPWLWQKMNLTDLKWTWIAWKLFLDGLIKNLANFSSSSRMKKS